MWITFDKYPLVTCLLQNCLITGYANDVVMLGKEEKEKGVLITFRDSRIRMPKIDLPYVNATFDNIVYEQPTDTAFSPKNTFMTFDEKNLYYDFRLKKGSGAINAGNALWTLPTDRLGKLRDAKPDLGAYEYAE